MVSEDLRQIFKDFSRILKKLARNSPKLVAKGNYVTGSHWEFENAVRCVRSEFTVSSSQAKFIACEAGHLRYCCCLLNNFGSCEFYVISPWLFV